MQHRDGTFLRLLTRLRDAQAGMAMVEFALVLPLLMTLMYGSIEVTRYVLITQKVEKLAHAVADMASQPQIATIGELNQVMAAAADVMRPFPLTTNGKVFITSLYRDVGAANAVVNWRYQSQGGLSSISQLGSIGSIPTMPAGFTFEERENVMAAEVYYQFSPLISNQFFGTTTVYRVAFYKPRLGALLNAPV